MATSFLVRKGQTYGDFQLLDYTEIRELQVVLRQLVHLPTGAQVMHLENDDPENLFCLSFKTLPDSSNGAAHILEHTVLCGSKKYPVKDPFFSMSKRSLNTFMNALTGSDFTCYPAASQVEPDFYNLLEVYLDAAFHPLLNEMSFLQEGHRLSFRDSDDPSSPLEFQGIVYNEMKGAMSSIDARIWQKLMQALTPDLPYAFNAGGDPKEIPSLTHEQLVKFHETFYHPSRALFFFYGSFPLKKHLDFIQKHALKGVEKIDPLLPMPRQRRFSGRVIEQHAYPTSEQGSLENEHIHSIGFLTAPLDNQRDVLALSVLDGVLMDTDASALKKALLDSGLCVDVDCLLGTDMAEMPLVFTFRGCRADAGEQLEALLLDVLREVANEGLAFAHVEAVIHQIELCRTEMGGDHSPFGLTLFMRAALAKQHGCAPESALVVHSLFEELLEGAQDPHFFTPLIERYLLNNPHVVRLAFAPDRELALRETQEEKARLEAIKSGLSDLECEELLEQSRKLKAFQELGEEHKLECLPKVTLKDVPCEARHFPLNHSHLDTAQIYHHSVFTNHILYADVICDLPNLCAQEHFDLQLFLALWPDLGSAGRSYVENLEFIHAHTGGIAAHASVHVQASDPMVMRPALHLHGKALNRKADKLFQVLCEMLSSPRFDEPKRIQELVKKLAVSVKNQLSRNAMRYAAHLAQMSHSPASQISEQWYGLSFYNNIQRLQSDVERDPGPFIERLKVLCDKLLQLSDLTLVLSCDAKAFEELDARGFYGFKELHSTPPTARRRTDSPPPSGHQARIIASPVAFSAYGLKAVSLGHEDSPALQLGSVLMENKVLHPRIRERGGAYGSGAHYNPLWGNFYFHAYRDPHIAQTYHTFREAVSEIAQGRFSPRDLEEAKLGIIQALDAPSAPGSRGLAGYAMLREGRGRELRQTFRDQLLAVESGQVARAVVTQLAPKLETATFATFASEELLNKELPKLTDCEISARPL